MRQPTRNGHRELSSGQVSTFQSGRAVAFPTDANNQPLDSSARKSLISRGARLIPCGLRAIRGERARREEWPGESERWAGTGRMADRRSPQVSARIRANTREPSRSDEKKPQLRTVGALIVVEAGGIEPPSENTSTQVSPSAVCLLGFPSRTAGKQAMRYGIL